MFNPGIPGSQTRIAVVVGAGVGWWGIGGIEAGAVAPAGGGRPPPPRARRAPRGAGGRAPPTLLALVVSTAFMSMGEGGGGAGGGPTRSRANPHTSAPPGRPGIPPHCGGGGAGGLSALPPGALSLGFRSKEDIELRVDAYKTEQARERYGRQSGAGRTWETQGPARAGVEQRVEQLLFLLKFSTLLPDIRKWPKAYAEAGPGWGANTSGETNIGGGGSAGGEANVVGGANTGGESNVGGGANSDGEAGRRIETKAGAGDEGQPVESTAGLAWGIPSLGSGESGGGIPGVDIIARRVKDNRKQIKQKQQSSQLKQKHEAEHQEREDSSKSAA
eukprot:gene21584-28582_t